MYIEECKFVSAIICLIWISKPLLNNGYQPPRTLIFTHPSPVSFIRGAPHKHTLPYNTFPSRNKKILIMSNKVQWLTPHHESARENVYCQQRDNIIIEWKMTDKLRANRRMLSLDFIAASWKTSPLSIAHLSQSA